MTKLHNSRTLKSRLLVCSALVGVSVALASGSANAQANIDFEFSTSTYSLSTDVGGLLTQSLTSTVTGTTSGTAGQIKLLTDVDSTVDYNGAYLLEDNSFQAEATGNTANGTVNLTFTPGVGTDTAAGGVGQEAVSNVTARVSGSQHLVQIENDSTDDVSELTGTLLVDNNDLLAIATANNASTTLTLANGVNAAGTTGQAQVTLDSTMAATTDSSSSGDMLVSQAQSLDEADSVAEIQGGSTGTGDNDVDVFVESIDGATLTLSNSDIQASATGNDLTASILSSDTTASIAATSATAGFQNLYGNVTASAANTVISVRGGSFYGYVDDSTLTVADNAIGAAATGSTATQSIDLVANQISGGGGFATLTDTTSTGVQMSAQAGHVAASVQSVSGDYTVSGSVSGAEVRLDTNVGGPGGYTINRNTLAVTDNSIAASGLGASATNSVALQAGSTLSSTGAVGSVQALGGISVSSTTENSLVLNGLDSNVADSTILTTGNTISASSTGGLVNNDLVVSNTDVLSLASNSGTVTIVADPTGAELRSPSVTAAFAVSNDQSVDDASVTSSVTGSSVRTELEYDGFTEVENDVNTSTINTDNNQLTASAIGTSANNAISLSFNVLDGGIATDGDVVGAAANSQDLTAVDISANVYDDRPIEVLIGEDIEAGGSTITANNNAVRASAVGNISTGTNVSVDATNVGISTGISGTAQVDKTDGNLTASAAFLAANQQEMTDSSVYAGQVNDTANPTTSNLIVVDADDNIEDATIQANSNVMSVAATGNTAATGVATGTDATATVQASSAVVNYQDLANATIQGALGTVGADGTPTFTSSTQSSNETAQIQPSGTDYINNGSAITFTFSSGLNATEQAILTAAGFTSVTATTAVWGAGATISPDGLLAVSYTSGNAIANDGDETLQVTSFNSAGTPPSLNTAGVIQKLGTGEATLLDNSTLNVDANTIVGEVRGNVATNSVTATATTLTAFSTASTPSTDTDNTTVVATNADNALTNVQEVDGTTVLTNTVAGTFALEFVTDPEVDGLKNSSLSVSDNLLQSYATTNTASNTVTLTATNSNAGAALLNEQSMAAPTGSGVVTVSDMDVASHAGTTSSDQALDNNTNQSVASANVETSTVTVSVTNGSPVAGTVDANYDGTPLTVTADALIASEQRVGDQTNPTPSITASATTDVFNEDELDTTANQLITSTLSMSGNDTVAQATGNTSTLSMKLGDSGTATYDANGAVTGQQVVSDNAVISATTNVEVGVSLQTSDDVNATFQSSTVGINGNTATALARGNVETATLTVSSTNIEAGTSSDASIGATLNSAAYLMKNGQTSGGDLSADSSAAVFSLSAIGTGSATEASDGSTLSVSYNLSSATAAGNTAANKMVLGSDATATLASTGLLLAEQTSTAQGSVSATGGMTASASLNSGSASDSTVVNGTTLTLAGNTSTSSATANSVSNTFTANATNMTAGAPDTDASLTTGVSTAANLLRNYQSAAQSVTSTNTANTVTATIATGNTANGETSTAVNASTVAVTGNAFNAYATGNSAGNTAANSMSIGGAGTSTLSATAGLVNNQSQTGAISASGSATAGVTANAPRTSGSTGTATALNASTVSVADNSVMVMARGNLANNSLSVGATSATGGDTANGSYDSTTVLATYGLLNNQTNSGAVSATSENAKFQVALNSELSNYGAAAAASTIGVSGNSVMAAAYGNVATNNLALASLEGTNDDATAITASYQEASTGAISANVTNGFAGVLANGPVGTSTVAVRGNTFTARAVGNFATSVVTRR